MINYILVFHLIGAGLMAVLLLLVFFWSWTGKQSFRLRLAWSLAAVFLLQAASGSALVWLSGGSLDAASCAKFGLYALLFVAGEAMLLRVRRPLFPIRGSAKIFVSN